MTVISLKLRDPVNGLTHLFGMFLSIAGLVLLVYYMMIYVLIAGTYTPICLIPLRGAWGWSLFGVIWGCALLGVVSNTFYKAPRWLSTLIYVVMGWLVVIVFWPLVKQVQFQGIVWLLAGGIFYSIGAIIYATKWPFNNAKWFGFHEIFHLFVIAGSLCHFWLMFKYLINI